MSSSVVAMTGLSSVKAGSSTFISTITAHHIGGTTMEVCTGGVISAQRHQSLTWSSFRGRICIGNRLRAAQVSFVGRKWQRTTHYSVKMQADGTDSVRCQELADGSLLFSFENDDVAGAAASHSEHATSHVPLRPPSNFLKRSPIPLRMKTTTGVSAFERSSQETSKDLGGSAHGSDSGEPVQSSRVPLRPPSRFVKRSPIATTAWKPLREAQHLAGTEAQLGSSEAESKLATPSSGASDSLVASEAESNESESDSSASSASGFASAIPSRPASKFTKRSPIARAIQSPPFGQSGASTALSAASSASSFPAIPSASSAGTVTNGVAVTHSEEVGPASSPPQRPPSAFVKRSSITRPSSTRVKPVPGLDPERQPSTFESASSISNSIKASGNAKPSRPRSAFVKRSPISSKSPSLDGNARQLVESDTPASAESEGAANRKRPGRPSSKSAKSSSTPASSSSQRPSRTSEPKTVAAEAELGSPSRPARLPSRFMKKVLMSPSPVRQTPVPHNLSGENNGAVFVSTPGEDQPMATEAGTASDSSVAGTVEGAPGGAARVKRGRKKTKRTEIKAVEFEQEPGTAAVEHKEEETGGLEEAASKSSSGIEVDAVAMHLQSTDSGKGEEGSGEKVVAARRGRRSRIQSIDPEEGELTESGGEEEKEAAEHPGKMEEAVEEVGGEEEGQEPLGENGEESLVEDREEVDLESMTVLALKDLAKGRGLKGYSKFKKSELVDFIRAAGV